MDEARTENCYACGQRIQADSSICPHCQEQLSVPPRPLPGGDKRIVPCQVCGHPNAILATSCPNCGNPNPIARRADAQRKSFRSFLTVILIGIGIFAVGKIHVITSRDLSLGFTISLRDSFGFSETFINADAITGMPWIAARSKYPIGCRFLLENGMVRRATLEESIEQWTP